MNKEEMLDIFLEETGSDRDAIMSYGRVKSITYHTSQNGKPIYLRRYALWIVSNNCYNHTLYQSDRYELVTDEEELENGNEG